jgi:glutamate synthase (NADPH/NADH) large chain
MTKTIDINQTCSCGVGFISNINGMRSHEIVTWGIEAVKNLTHRGAVGATAKQEMGQVFFYRYPEGFFLKK